MLATLFESLRGRVFRVGLCFLTLLGIGGGFGLYLSAAEAMVARGQDELGRESALGYDILVRPPGSRSVLERSTGLLEPNYLTTLPGGISFDQYETIRAMPGIEVAAPIANLGTYRQPLYVWVGDTTEPGLYAVSCSTELTWAGRTTRQETVTYRYSGEDSPALTRGDEDAHRLTSGLLPPVCSYALAVTVTGISPEEEAALTGLDRTVAGTWLTSDMVVPSTAYQMSSGEQVLATIPAIVRASQTVSATFSSELIPLAWPEEATGIRDVIDLGGPETLPRLDPLVRTVLDGPTAYQTLLGGLVGRGGKRFNVPQFRRLAAPSGVVYRATASPAGSDMLTFEAIAVGASGKNADALPVFRTAEPEALKVGFYYSLSGTYEPALLSAAADDLLPPSLAWDVPAATLAMDPEGKETSPLPLTQSLGADGYLSPPPTVLTTMEAARLLAGEEAISAIRVRVAGVDSLTPEAMERIRGLANDIAARTGLDVDVVAGSARRPVLVHLPGYASADGSVAADPLGYAEETWLERDAGLTLTGLVAQSTARLSGPFTALYAALVVGCLPALLAGRRADYALLGALGWRRSAIVGYAVVEGLLIGGAAGLAGFGLASAAASRYDLGQLSEDAWVVLPLAAVSAMAATLTLALAATRAIRPRATRPTRVIWLRGWYGWSPSGRDLLTLLLAAAGAFLVVGLQGALSDLPSRLHGTPLGDWLVAELLGPRDVITGSALVVALLATTGSLLGGAAARRQEIGVLLALGWRTRTVVLRSVAEGFAQTLAGGLAGAFLGGTWAVQRYHTDMPTLLWTAGITVLVLLVGTLLAGLYPAWLARRGTPADVVRAR